MLGLRDASADVRFATLRTLDKLMPGIAHGSALSHSTLTSNAAVERADSLDMCVAAIEQLSQSDPDDGVRHQAEMTLRIASVDRQSAGADAGPHPTHGAHTGVHTSVHTNVSNSDEGEGDPHEKYVDSEEGSMSSWRASGGRQSGGR